MIRVIKDFMVRKPVTVKATDKLIDAIDKMEKGNFRHLPVVDDQGLLIGMLTDRDIRLHFPSPAFVRPEYLAGQLFDLEVRDAAVFDPVSVEADDSVEQCAEIMLKCGVGGLPVLDKGGTLVGIITYTDLLRAFVAKRTGKEGEPPK
ncbi:MAG: CBS domain-containing protein [Candidatus Omnitrophica bacterium]|nr:CBS domain-containing protein [Candidatus Omnitrophota bacterium]